MAKGKFQKWIEPDGLILLEGWARDGLTDELIAKQMGINTGTLYRWKNEHHEICEALKKGKEVTDRKVESALLKRALGYRYIERTTETRYDAEGNPYEYVKETEKEVVPDVTAQIYWLKNRKPAQWRDRPAESMDADDESGVIMLPPVLEDPDE